MATSSISALLMTFIGDIAGVIWDIIPLVLGVASIFIALGIAIRFGLKWLKKTAGK